MSGRDEGTESEGTLRLEPRTRIALVRHGMTDWNQAGRLQGRTDVPLNDAGRVQAAQAAAALEGERWSAIYSSPLIRARETAAIIGRRLGLSPQTVPGLIERDYGPLEGLTRAEIERRYPDRARQPAPPGVEPPEQVRARAEASLRTLARQHGGEGIVVVSHGAWINALLYEISGGTMGTGITNLANGGISYLYWSDSKGWSIETVNITRHLALVHGMTDQATENRKAAGGRRKGKGQPRG